MATSAAIGRRKAAVQPVDPKNLTVQALLTAAAALLGQVPESTKKLILVIFVLSILDTVTGIWLAGREHKVRSRTMREQLCSKSLQFLGIATLGACASIMTEAWAYFSGTLGLIIAIEAKSNIENLLRLEQTGGAPLGPFRPAIWKLGEFFAVAQPPNSTVSVEAEKEAGPDAA